MDGNEHVENQLKKHIDDRLIQSFRDFEGHIFKKLDGQIGERMDRLIKKERKFIAYIKALENRIEKHEDEMDKHQQWIEWLGIRKTLWLLVLLFFTGINSALATVFLLWYLGWL